MIDTPALAGRRRMLMRCGVAGIMALMLAGCSTSSNIDSSAKSLEDLKTPSQSLVRLANAARDAADYPAAIGLYRRALAAGGDPFQVHLGLGQSLLAAGSAEEARGEFEAASAIAPDRPEPKLGRARIALSRRDPTAALAILSEATGKGESSPDLLDGKAVALDLLGQHAEAQKTYLTALQRAPDSRRIRSNYGLSLVLTRDYPQAVQILQPFANDPTASSRNRQNLALALGLNGDTDAARAVAGQDLDTASVDENLEFYRTLRGSRQVSSSSSSPSSSPTAGMP
jgi:Flp pilus assembly protein TadD